MFLDSTDKCARSGSHADCMLIPQRLRKVVRLLFASRPADKQLAGADNWVRKRGEKKKKKASPFFSGQGTPGVVRQSPSRPGGIARSRNTPGRRQSPALPAARTPPPSPDPLLPRGPAGLGAPGGLPRGRAGAASRSRPLAFRRAAFLRCSGSSLSPTPASQRSFAGFGRYGRLQLYPQNPSVRLPECADGCIGRSLGGGSVDRIRSAERI